MVSAAICVSEHITETVRPVSTPPLSPCRLPATNTDEHSGLSYVEEKTWASVNSEILVQHTKRFFRLV